MFPALAQLDADATGKILDRIPQEPHAWMGWLIAALAAAFVLTIVLVLKGVLAKRAEAPTPQPAPPPEREVPSCRIDHSAINTRLQFLERDVSEIRAMHKESIDVAREAAEAGREAARAIREAVRLLESLSTATAQSAQVLHQSITTQSATIPLWAQQVINELRSKRGEH